MHHKENITTEIKIMHTKFPKYDRFSIYEDEINFIFIYGSSDLINAKYRTLYQKSLNNV